MQDDSLEPEDHLRCVVENDQHALAELFHDSARVLCGNCLVRKQIMFFRVRFVLQAQRIS
jgi:hypothetical protein